jgi:hypothetical protein
VIYGDPFVGRDRASPAEPDPVAKHDPCVPAKLKGNAFTKIGTIADFKLTPFAIATQEESPRKTYCPWTFGQKPSVPEPKTNPFQKVNK